MRKSLKNTLTSKPKPTAGNPRPPVSRVTTKAVDCPRWSKSGVQWPRAGGHGFQRAKRELFQSAAFLERYRPGVERLIYVATCPGARRLAGEIQMPFAKISTCRAGRLPKRLDEQSNDAYGAGYMRGDELVIEPGWNSWDAVVLRPIEGPSPGSPVSVGARCILIVLPDVMDEAEFDALWDEETCLAAIDVWSRTEAGKSQLAKIGVDPAKAQRRTVYHIDTKPRVSATRELCVYRLSQDTDRLIEIAERIILRALGLV